MDIYAHFEYSEDEKGCVKYVLVCLTVSISE
jgi:hypothetical protein